MYCNDCQLDKTVEDMVKSSKSLCKKCATQRTRLWRTNPINRKRTVDSNRKSRLNMSESKKIDRYKKNRAYYKLWYAEHGRLYDPVKTKARNVLNRAVAFGDIQKPLSCSLCNKKAQLEAHHDDYSLPLNVIWTCKSCHRTVHSGR